MAQPDDSISIFISYSHRDDELRQELDSHLSGLRWQDGVAIRHDRRILAGEEWAREINHNLEADDVILLLSITSPGNQPEEIPLRDFVFLCFLSGQRPDRADRLAVSAPDLLRLAFFNDGQPNLGVRAVEAER